MPSASRFFNLLKGFDMESRIPMLVLCRCRIWTAMGWRMTGFVPRLCSIVGAKRALPSGTGPHSTECKNKTTMIPTSYYSSMARTLYVLYYSQPFTTTYTCFLCCTVLVLFVKRTTILLRRQWEPTFRRWHCSRAPIEYLLSGHHPALRSWSPTDGMDEGISLR